MRRTILFAFASAGVGLTVAFLVLLVALIWMEVEGPDLSGNRLVFYLVLQGGLPLLGGVSMWRTLSRDEGATPSIAAPARWWRRVIVAAYVITAIFGIPAAQSEWTNRAIAKYVPDTSGGSSWTTASVPLVPGVILSYRDYQFGPKSAAGGFELSIWYAVGVRSLTFMSLWIR